MPKITASTQVHLNIADIKNDLLILKGGRYSVVLEVDAVNFDLLSEAEQDATIYSFANLLNSLDFPIQVVIRTRQVEISDYLEFLTQHEQTQPSEALRDQLREYIEFVKQLVIENTILAKRFFIVIPFQILQIRKELIFEPLLRLLPGYKKRPAPEYSYQNLEDVQRALNQREEALSWQLRRAGVQTRRLTTQELVSLFYEIYNPAAPTEPSGLAEDTRGYLTPLVKPSIVPSAIKEAPPPEESPVSGENADFSGEE